MRDWFASQALNALIAKDSAHASWELLNDGEPPAVCRDNDGSVAVVLPPSEACYDDPYCWKAVVNAAYGLADAMLERRKTIEPASDAP